MKKVELSTLNDAMIAAVNRAVKNQLNIRQTTKTPESAKNVGLTIFKALYEHNLASIYLLDRDESPFYPLSSGGYFDKNTKEDISYFSTDGLSSGEEITIYLRDET